MPPLGVGSGHLFIAGKLSNEVVHVGCCSLSRLQNEQVGLVNE